MKRLLLIWLFLVPGVYMRAADEVTQQCSSIRELVYVGWTNQFSNIVGDRVRSSNGHSENPLWRFTNTRYFSDLAWPGAKENFIEDYDEETDSIRLRNMQFIAEMGTVEDLLTAQKLLRSLNREIEGCPYLHNDSLRTVFQPLPFDNLPATCPANLQFASLYELPLHDTTATSLHQLSIMTGIERSKQYYRVSLIVEDRRLDKKYK